MHLLGKRRAKVLRIEWSGPMSDNTPYPFSTVFTMTFGMVLMIAAVGLRHSPYLWSTLKNGCIFIYQHWSLSSKNDQILGWRQSSLVNVQVTLMVITTALILAKVFPRVGGSISCFTATIWVIEANLRGGIGSTTSESEELESWPVFKRLLIFCRKIRSFQCVRDFLHWSSPRVSSNWKGHHTGLQVGKFRAKF